MKSITILATFIISSGLLLTKPSGSGSSPDTPAGARKESRSPAPGPVGTVSIVIDKSDYELSVFDEKGWYATYPVVFGTNNLGDKKMEGDKQTPEGVFHITNKKMHEKWHRFMGLDYPTQESWSRFNSRKQKGEIPSTASIGGSIGIHGTWPHEDFMIDKFKNWTMGCISMKNADVAEIFTFIPSGTQVTIRK